jgi:hypothetical protein
MKRMIVVTALAALVFVAGCGGDEEMVPVEVEMIPSGGASYMANVPGTTLDATTKTHVAKFEAERGSTFNGSIVYLGESSGRVDVTVTVGSKTYATEVANAGHNVAFTVDIPR